jgi:hypothetical protein
MNVSIELQGTTPLLMHNPRLADPEFELTREIKALTAKRKKTDEDLAQIGRLEWYGGLFTEQNGSGPVVVQPTAKIRKCLIETGKISKLGRAIERAVTFRTLNVALTYDGPSDIDKLYRDPRFSSRLAVGVSGRRVMRVRPQFPSWALRADAVFIPDAGLNPDELERIVELAGVVEGLGDGRKIGYGRFRGSVSWS